MSIWHICHMTLILFPWYIGQMKLRLNFRNLVCSSITLVLHDRLKIFWYVGFCKEDMSRLFTCILMCRFSLRAGLVYRNRFTPLTVRKHDISCLVTESWIYNLTTMAICRSKPHDTCQTDKHCLHLYTANLHPTQWLICHSQYLRNRPDS